MKSAIIPVALLFMGTPYADAARGEAQHQAHPVGKVIGMLEGLMAKTEAMGKVEAASYAKYVGWCQVQSSTLKNAIEEEKAKISELADTISAKTKEQKGLETQLEELSEQITDMEASAMKAEKLKTPHTPASEISDTTVRKADAEIAETLRQRNDAAAEPFARADRGSSSVGRIQKIGPKPREKLLT